MALNYQRSGNAQIDAMLKSLRERAIIGFGDPNLTGVGFNLDPVTAAQAQANYNSGNATLARLVHGNDIARQSIINSLAGHNILHSGALGYREGEQGRAYGNQVYDARQQLIDYLSKAAQDAQDRRNALQQTVMQAYMDAYANGYNGPLPDFSNPGATTGGAAPGGGSKGGSYGAGLEVAPGNDAYTKSGYTNTDLLSAADAYARARGWSPRAGGYEVMHNGVVETQNGVPGVWFKFDTPQGSSTEFVPLGQPGASSTGGGSSTAAPQSGVVSAANPFGLNLA